MCRYVIRSDITSSFGGSTTKAHGVPLTITLTILDFAADSAAMAATLDGLRHNGQLVVLGAVPEPIEVSPFQIIATSRTVHGHPSGTAREVEETLRFAALTGVRPVTQTRPLAEVNEAYRQMLDGKARHRMVLTTGA